MPTFKERLRNFSESDMRELLLYAQWRYGWLKDYSGPTSEDLVQITLESVWEPGRRRHPEGEIDEALFFTTFTVC